MNKKIIFLGMLFGGTIGSYIPTIFGASAFSLVSILCGAAGGLLGIWLSFKLLN
jgi:hypothetical protein